MEQVENKTNGNGQTYEEFVKEMVDKGLVQDATEFAADGIGLIRPPEEKHTNAALLGSVPGANNFYDKKEKNKGILLDLLARTNFRNHNEMIHFLDWCEWCEDFGVPLDGPLRYLVGVTSQGGVSREQYVDAITTQRIRSFGSSRNDARSTLRAKPQDGILP